MTGFSVWVIARTHSPPWSHTSPCLRTAAFSLNQLLDLKRKIIRITDGEHILPSTSICKLIITYPPQWRMPATSACSSHSGRCHPESRTRSGGQCQPRVHVRPPANASQNCALVPGGDASHECMFAQRPVPAKIAHSFQEAMSAMSTCSPAADFSRN